MMSKEHSVLETDHCNEGEEAHRFLRRLKILGEIIVD
jgi:hypothetical protein